MLAQRHPAPARGWGTRAGTSSSSAPSLLSALGPGNHNHRRRQRRANVAASASNDAHIATDASGRVAGTPDVVASYIGRVDETWPTWYPRLAKATRLADNKSKFEVVVRAAGGGGGQGGSGGNFLASFLPTVDLAVEVELLEQSPRRVVFRATSPFHAAQEQYVLMPCPADPRGHTSVRHVSEVRLKGAWANALAAPVVGGLMRAVPREALERLAAALRVEQQQRERRQQQQQQAGRRRSGGGGGSGSGSGSGSGEFWGGLFGGAATSTSTSTSSSSSDDPHGLYAALALDPRDRPAAEAIRAAYRKRAAQAHPDAHVGAASDAARARAAADFARVARAHAVLSDDGARRAYDRGEWRPAEGEEGL